MLLLLEFIYKLNQFIIALIEITVNKWGMACGVWLMEL